MATLLATLTGSITTNDVVATFIFTGSATSTTDYTTSTGTITILAGNTTGSILIAALQDTIDEVDETIDWILDTLVNAQTGTVSTGTVDILDDDILTVEVTVDTGSVVES